jgi:hypothetical protein
MSEYQYYEFCQINKPLSKEARQEMRSLSSRANIGSHGASYVYNYGDFRGDPKQLLLKYFDVFFYISNFGTVELIFKYPIKHVDIPTLKKYYIEHVIEIEQHEQHILLEVCIDNEEGFGWTEGEGLLPNLLPLYDEIKAKNYQFLSLVQTLHCEFSGEEPDPANIAIAENTLLSEAQQTFLECVGVDHRAIIT